MNFLVEFFQNKILVCALLGYITAQLLKLLIALIREKRFRIGLLISSGGMPSSHVATVVAMTTSIAFVHGISSTYFAIAFVISAIVIYDATGVRRETGEQAKLLNVLIDDLFNEKDTKVTFHHFKEFVGHTPVQVFAGAVLGVVIPFFYMSKI